MSFETLGLHTALTSALSIAGYTAATDVQTRAIPPALEGRDLMVSSSTGSGKTASFALPALMRVLKGRAVLADLSLDGKSFREILKERVK